MNQLQWTEDHDQHDRLVHQAASIYHDDGAHFVFRIRETKRGYCIEQSDAELIIGTPRRWPTVEMAKTEIQKFHEDMIAAEAKQRGCDF